MPHKTLFKFYDYYKLFCLQRYGILFISPEKNFHIKTALSLCLDFLLTIRFRLYALQIFNLFVPPAVIHKWLMQ